MYLRKKSGRHHVLVSAASMLFCAVVGRKAQSLASKPKVWRCRCWRFCPAGCLGGAACCTTGSAPARDHAVRCDLDAGDDSLATVRLHILVEGSPSQGLGERRVFDGLPGFFQGFREVVQVAPDRMDGAGWRRCRESA